MILSGIVLMILSGAFWAASGVIVAAGTTKKVSMAEAMCCSALFSVMIAIPVLFCRPDPAVEMSVRLQALASVAGAGFVNFFHMVVMRCAMRNGPNGIAWAIIQSGMVIPFLAGTLFFGEKASVSRLTGLVLLLAALALFAWARDNSFSQGSRKIWMLASLSGFFLAGTNQTLVNLPSYFQAADAIGSVSRTLALQTGIFCAWLFSLPFRYKQAVRGFSRATVLTAAGLAAVTIGNGFFVQYYGMNILAQSGFGSVSIPIVSASCLIFFTLFSLLKLREKLSWPSRLALVFCILGVILMSLKNH